MKHIVNISILTILLAAWAFGGQTITEWGYKLNSLTEIPILGYLFWTILGLSILFLLLCLLQLIGDILSGKRLINVLIIAVFLLLIYFSADIIHKGKTLNELTPYPLLGWLFWGLIVFFIYRQVLCPIVCFAQLRNLGEQNLQTRAELALKSLKRDKNSSLYTNISNAKQLHKTEELRTHLQTYDKLLEQKANDIILNYSKISGVAAIVSRNKWIDSAALIYLQCRMIVELAKLYGGKPTPVFNLLTLLWVLSSSCVYIIMQSLIVENADALAQELTDTVSEYLTGDLDSQAKAATGAFNALPFLKVVSSVSSVIIGPVLEASAAGANTYITGKMYIWKLKSEDISLKKYLNERNRARMITCGYLMKAAPGVTQFKDAITHGIKKLVKEDKEETA